MDKFLTFPGQQPIYLGDIDFMQTAVGNALKNLLISYTGDADGSAILVGVEITTEDGDVSWTAGVVAIEGEILPIEAGSITGGASGTLYFDIVNTLSGSRTMKDGTVRQCWQTRAATITTTETDYLVTAFERIGFNARAAVYEFESTPVSGYEFAVLANCGGAWVFAMRKTIGAGEGGGNTLFFEENASPHRIDIFNKLNSVDIPVIIVHSPVNGAQSLVVGRLRVFGWAVQVTSSELLVAGDNYYIQTIIPVF